MPVKHTHTDYVIYISKGMGKFPVHSVNPYRPIPIPNMAFCACVCVCMRGNRLDPQCSEWCNYLSSERHRGDRNIRGTEKEGGNREGVWGQKRKINRNWMGKTKFMNSCPSTLSVYCITGVRVSSLHLSHPSVINSGVCFWLADFLN